MRLLGTAARLRRWFDDRFRQMALDDGATECHFPSAISRQTLERASYFESFPEGATAIGGAPRTDFYLSPAVCFHAYDALADRSVGEATILTAAHSCFRESDRRAPGAQPGRLWEFTMREVIFVGAAPWVATQRTRWRDRVDAFARELALPHAIEPATDTFFGDLSRGQRLIQQLKGLKDELRLEVGSGTLAAASFNLHDTFFGSRFNMMLANGSPAHSGCVAFGLERWTIALLAQRGEAAAQDLLKG